MSKLHTFSVAIALGFLGAASVNAQEVPPPRPSTSPTEGTAADRTRPGETPTKDALPPQPTDPRPATSETEGTAADRTAPGRTKAQTAQDRATSLGAQRSEIVGAAVVTKSQAPLGEVVDVVFDAANRPEFVVIEADGKATAIPYSVANANKQADKLVIDESRLRGAPKVEQGAWRMDGAWKKDATRYWNKG